MAVQAHEGQKRLSGDPYITHCIAVAHMLADMGADGDTLCAALLHDTVEDTPILLADIEREFDGGVAAIVDGVTKLDESDVAEKPTLDEQVETLRKIFTLMQKDVRIIVVKLVDRLHNMQTASYLREEKRRLLAKETMEVYVKIADRLCMQDLRDELEALCLQVLDPEMLERMLLQRAKNEHQGDKVIRDITKSLHASHPSLSNAVKPVYEIKSWNKLRMQVETEGMAVTGIATLIVAFICKDVDTCYRTFGALHQLWQRETLSFQDFINAPMINGYQGLHTTVILADGTRVRCKIRTQEMHEYARRGIATKCFDGEAFGLLEYLPWAERIQTLSEDTAERSEEFWENLQSDILGESIVIHGPDDRTISLPKGSTALDGAFYLFHENALSLKSIRVDGKEALFSTPLTHATSLDVTLNHKQTVSREWLDWVETGFATAIIRSALGSKTNRQMVRIGKELFQQFLEQQRRGYIEEFNQAAVLRNIAPLGYESLEQMYTALASGHVTPKELSSVIFRSFSDAEAEIPYTIQYSFPLGNGTSIDNLSKIYQKHARQYSTITVRHDLLKGVAHAVFKTKISPDQQPAMAAELVAAGATDVSVRPTLLRYKNIFGIVSIILLWGLDPVFGYLLLHTNSISVIDMTLVRFWSLTGISALLLLWQKTKRSRTPEAPLPLFSPSLWTSVCLLIGIAIFTYTALLTTDPSHYTIPMTAAGVLTTSIVHRNRRKTLAAAWGLIALGIGLLALWSPEWRMDGMLPTFMAIAAFSGFSIVSEQYKKRENIAARSAQYFFVLSVLCFLLTLPLLTISTLSVLPGNVMAQMVLFSIFFAGLPYYLYYFFLTHRAIDFVLRYSFLIIFASVGGQMLFIKDAAPTTLIAAGVVILGALVPLLPARGRTTAAAVHTLRA